MNIPGVHLVCIVQLHNHFEYIIYQCYSRCPKCHQQLTVHGELLQLPTNQVEVITCNTVGENVRNKSQVILEKLEKIASFEIGYKTFLLW